MAWTTSQPRRSSACKRSVSSVVARLGSALLFWLGLLQPVSGQAPQALELGPPGCIDRLAGRPANGIDRGSPLREPLVRLCDGTWRRVILEGQQLRLAVSAGPEAASPATDGLMLPDGEISRGENHIAEAWLVGPTTIYGHGILGDRTEASGIHVRLTGGGSRELFLGRDSVFEDLRVRLVDLTGDGKDEIVVIRSYLNRGAALAVYGVSSGGLRLLGESPPIGLPNRWLNPAGAADFDGDGRIEIALVETPHIGGTLRIFSLGPDGLVQEASEAGFSNHAIGSRVLDLSAVLDWNADGRPDLALPDAGRGAMVVVGIGPSGRLERLAKRAHSSQIVTAVRATDLDRDGRAELYYGLRDGTLVLLRPE